MPVEKELKYRLKQKEYRKLRQYLRPRFLRIERHENFYFDTPDKIESALYWVRSYINPLTESPYDMAPEFMDIKVIIHGTEIVTLAKKNYDRYSNAVERMKYYHSLGVEFRVCGLAAKDFDYTADDFYSFVKITPSAIIELGHWQQENYAIIKPEILEKKFSIDEIR